MKVHPHASIHNLYTSWFVCSFSHSPFLGTKNIPSCSSRLFQHQLKRTIAWFIGVKRWIFKTTIKRFSRCIDLFGRSSSLILCSSILFFASSTTKSKKRVSTPPIIAVSPSRDPIIFIDLSTSILMNHQRRPLSIQLRHINRCARVQRMEQLFSLSCMMTYQPSSM